MAYWLFKEEPDHYSYADLERDGQTVWDGIRNNLALQNLRLVRKGDKAFFYHTGNERAVVGEMMVCSDPKPDAASDNAKAVWVEVRPVRRLHPVPLSRIKKEPTLATWDLIRLSRLSIVPVTEAQWKCVQALSHEGEPSNAG